MAIPKRIQRQEGRHALVDGIPFALPVVCRNSPALFAVFPINYEKAKALLPGNEIHPVRLWKKALLVVSVINYLDTSIGKYIEYSIAIACTHGAKPAPPLLPGLFTKFFGTGQYVLDLPVSSEISVKGGKGIWGMPKHQGHLDYRIEESSISSQYDLDGKLCMRVEIARPKSAWLPMSMAAANYCMFRGMLMKSYVYFKGKLGFTFFKKGAAKLLIGDHPRMAILKTLEIEPDPVMTAFIPTANGVLDDHFECWFIAEPQQPTATGESLQSVIDLGLGEQWLEPPSAAGRLENR